MKYILLPMYKDSKDQIEVWAFSSTLEVWDFGVEFIRLWALQLQYLFVACFSQGGHQLVLEFSLFTISLSCK